MTKIILDDILLPVVITVGNKESRKMTKKHLNKEIILEKTLEMIQKEEGITGLNLRSIAKELNCSHQNFYNYFKDFNDLLWNATAEAILILSRTIFVGKTIESLVSNYIDFAFENRGLYKLIWYETIKSEMPEEIKDLMNIPAIKSMEIIQNSFTREEVETYKNTISVSVAYVHGELAMALNGRIEVNEENYPQWKKRVEENSLKIFYNLEK